MTFLRRMLASCALSALVLASQCAAQQQELPMRTAGMSTADFAALSYVQKVVQTIRYNTAYSGVIPADSNPAAGYQIELLPDGTITKVELKQSSGIAAFDEAVYKAITRSSPLPSKTHGEPERKLFIHFQMKKQPAG